MFMIRMIQFATAVALIFTLAACGGGEDDGGTNGYDDSASGMDFEGPNGTSERSVGVLAIEGVSVFDSLTPSLLDQQFNTGFAPPNNTCREPKWAAVWDISDIDEALDMAEMECLDQIPSQRPRRCYTVNTTLAETGIDGADGCIALAIGTAWIDHTAASRYELCPYFIGQVGVPLDSGADYDAVLSIAESHALIGCSGSATGAIVGEGCKIVHSQCTN